MRVLGIETSCDETAVAVYDGLKGLLAEEVYSQILHEDFGGVVPELAARDHLARLPPMVHRVLKAAHTASSELEGIAYTKGPGLISALFVGATFARTLGYQLGIPTMGVHHLEGHLLAPMLGSQKPEFPFLALLVSGGHTELILAERLGHYQLLGQTLDDAAGEAFDKTAKLLGLGYPGGRALSELAEHATRSLRPFPRPMCDRPGLDFSFSGLKTHAAEAWLSSNKSESDAKEIAYALQEAIVETLFIKCERALRDTKLQRLVVSGGVSANRLLRKKLQELHPQGVTVFLPRLEWCTDNAAMIAYVGHEYLSRGESDPLAIQALSRWPLGGDGGAV